MAAPVTTTSTSAGSTAASAGQPVGARRRSPAGSFWLFWGAIALMLVFGWLIWRFVYGAKFKDIDARRAEERAKIYTDVASTSSKSLSDPASYLNKEKGVVRLPISDAMRLTLIELEASKPRAAYPIAATDPAPAPVPAPGPAGGNTPAASGAAATPGAAPAAAAPPPTTNANNPVLPNQSTAPAPAPQPEKPNPSSGGALGPNPSGNPAASGAAPAPAAPAAAADAASSATTGLPAPAAPTPTPEPGTPIPPQPSPGNP